MTSVLGEAFSKQKPRVQLAQATKVREVALEHLRFDWPEAHACSGRVGLVFDTAVELLATKLHARVAISDKHIRVIARLVDSVFVDQRALKELANARLRFEEEMKRFAALLPVAQWWQAQKGCDLLGLAQIVGEAGNLSNYSGPDKLKKRLGLAPYTKNDVTRAAQHWAISGGLTAEDWKKIGYSPRRRSVMYRIGDAIIKTGNGSHFRKLYDDRKAYLAERALARGWQLVAAAKETADAWEERGLPRPVVTTTPDDSKCVRVSVINKQAKYRMEQQILVELWCQWRDTAGVADRDTFCRASPPVIKMRA
jgi:hypothetical protein